MKIAILITTATLLSGCAASQTSVDYGNGFKRYFARGGVDMADCGTHQLSDLFWVDKDSKEEKYVSSHSERGHALHCDLSVAIINAGATVGAANQIRRGVAAGADSITNNTNANAEANANSNANVKVKAISGNSHNEEGHTKGGNNGKGNGDGDGSNSGTDNHHNNGDNN